MENSSGLRELKGKRLIGYTLGNFGMTLFNIYIGMYTFQFYVYTINLDSTLASAGLSVNIILSAFFAVIFGVVIDNKKPTKFGKRRPFLLYATPVWVIASILTYFPPWYCPPDNPLYLPVALYFWTVVIIRGLSLTLIFNTYISMLPEQSQTLKNRSTVASWRSFYMIVASVISVMLPLIIQSILPDPSNVKWWQPSGQIILTYIPRIAIILSFFGVAGVLVIFFSVDESFHLYNSNNKNKERNTIRNTFRQMSQPARDKKYRSLVFTGLFIGISSSILGFLIFPFQIYLLEFTDAEFLIYPIISISGKLAWYFIWRLVLRKRDLVKSYIISLVIGALAAFTDLLFLISNLPPEIKMLLYIVSFGTILGTNYAVPLFGIPLGATLIHEAAERKDPNNVDETISNISGSYYGFSSFVGSMGRAFSSIIVGLILTGDNKSNPLILTLLFASQGVFYLIAVIFLRRIKIKKRYNQIDKSKNFNFQKNR